MPVAGPRRAALKDTQQYRIIPSRYPPVELFETLVDADELAVLYAIESLTNDRIQAEAGNLYLLDPQEWVTGPGASVVMAPFTHVGGSGSRFSDGSFGVYYAGLTLETAVAETVFHTQRRMQETAESAIELDMRCYVGRVAKPMEDIRGQRYADLRNPDMATWPTCQQFAAGRRAAGANGLVYASARCDGECIAAFLPSAVTLPAQSVHLRYCWNGERIEHVLRLSAVDFTSGATESNSAPV